MLSFLSHLNQIGQTGSTPRYPKGLSTCCHGEEPHTVGWRSIAVRRAISLDPDCGWARGKADVLYVADAFAVMRKVNGLLAAGKWLLARGCSWGVCTAVVRWSAGFASDFCHLVPAAGLVRKNERRDFS